MTENNENDVIKETEEIDQSNDESSDAPAINGAWMIENKNYSRGKSALIIGVLIWLLGFLSIFSFNILSGFTFWKGTLFDNFDYLASNILLPLSGLLFTIFASWIMKMTSTMGMTR